MRIKNRLLPLLAIGVIVAALPFAVACGGGDDENGGNGAESTATNGDNGGGEAQTITVSMKDNLFDPKDITVEEGTVTFELKNDGAAIHNMHIMSKDAEGKDFMSKTTIEGGATDTFTATFTKSGSIKFQCDFHVPDMAGTITVE
jgi:plastocyanin